MTYYKVPEQLGGRHIGKGWYFIAGELWTNKECQRRGIDPGRLVAVEVPKSRVYWLFGARFSALED